MKKKVFLSVIILSFMFSFVTFNADTQTEIENKEKEIQEISKSLEDLNDQIVNKQAEIDRLELEVNEVDTNIASLDAEIEDITQQILYEKKYAKRSLVALQYAKYAKLDIYTMDGTFKVNNLYNFSLVINYLFGDIGKLISQQQNLESKNLDVQKLKSDLEKDMTDLEIQKDSLNDDQKELQEKSDKVKQEIVDLNEQLEIEMIEDAYISDEEKVILMNNAGIDSTQQQYADYIITHESGWNYKATNSLSGAYGLCQALPGSKMAEAGSDWETSPQTQVNWCDSYAVSRYGSWEAAYNFWVENHWW